MPNIYRCRLALLAAACCAAAAACGPTAPQTNGYKPGVVPGMDKAHVTEILGPPKADNPFELQTIKADVMTYDFGQVLLQDDRVVAITVADDPSYVGPMGIKLGVNEDSVKAAYGAHRKHRTGHRDAYDVVVGTNDTRTRDLYDQTDHLIIEMAAANPNDPLAPFNVISITEANDAGFDVLSAITKAKVGGLYPDQHVFNYVSEPWRT